MKNIVKFLSLSLVLFISVSCEKVIDVNLDTAPPKLVIDASIKWVKGTNGNDQIIKLTTTTSYFNSSIPAVSGATVFITDSANNNYNFTETTANGEYRCTNFNAVINATYVLTVVYNSETFTATETLKPVASIDMVQQENNTGFSGNDVQVKAFFTDNGATNDFYLFKYKPTALLVPTYDVTSDEFYQGNQFFGIYADKNLVAGQTLEISINGISERYYNYMNKLISLAGSNNGSPFQSPPATVRGNIINNSNESNFALGYFSLSEVDFRNYVVQ